MSMKDPAPRWIGKYEILSAIGDGGMAKVYQARFQAPGGASKQVALKLVHPHLGRVPEFVKMFLHEMRVAMAMSHRNVVQTFDAGKIDESYYLVMELMDRGSLGDLLITSPAEQRRLPLDIALFITMEVTAALDYAHTFRPEEGEAAGVIHRDVSPGNILLSTQGEVKLADFGVAKVTGHLTSSFRGAIKGKLSYMAPEQARGEERARSDLFSLGAVLYRMAVGEPFRTNPSLEGVRAGPLQVTVPADRREGIPLSLQQLIGRCLERDPKKRPSAGELRGLLAEELDRAQLRLGQGRDSHARLRSFLADRPEGEGPVRRLADAVMEIALAVPTHHGEGDDAAIVPPSPAIPETTEMIGSSDLDPESALEQRGSSETIIEPEPGQSRARRGGLLVALAGVLLAVSITIIWWLARSPEWAASRAHVVQDASSEVDAGFIAAGAVDAGGSSAGQDLGLVISGTTDGGADRADLVEKRELPPRRPRGPTRRFGRLDLNASPWAKVYIDGRYIGETPLQGVRLRAGRHRLRLVNPERKLRAVLTVRVRAGRTVRRSVRLRP